MDIKNLKDDQLENLIGNYARKGVSTGGPFPLDVCMRERAMRQPTEFDVNQTFDAIVEMSRNSEDGTITYGALFERLSGGRPFVGHHSLKNIGNALGKVVARCINEKLPILTALVVPQNGMITQKAIENIYEESRRLGKPVPPNPNEFYEQQLRDSRELIRRLEKE